MDERSDLVSVDIANVCFAQYEARSKHCYVAAQGWPTPSMYRMSA